MRLFLGLAGAVALSVPGIAATCIPFRNMQEHVLTNFSQARMEKRDNLPSIADSFPGADRCLSRKAGEADRVARMQCYWSTNVEEQLTTLLQDLKTCYPEWKAQELANPAAVRQVIFKQDEARAGVWLVQTFNANTKLNLMLVYMQKVNP